MRKPIIAGNWKMHKTPAEAVSLVKELMPLVKDASCEVIVCPTFTSLYPVLEEVKGSNIAVGAQNMYFEESGAFTGEISPLMLKEMGVKYVILGHSERREYFKEDDSLINKKVQVSFDYDLIPILCVGETLEEKEAGNTKSKISGQIKAGLNGLTSEKVASMVIAYEPIWAIGTGKTATSEDANDVIKFIREEVKSLYGEVASDAVRIQYGGSVKPSTIKEQMAQSDIDGALVGGAALKAEDFSGIVNF
ncbi:triose-phosphate isomerase [Clostridium cylindrosporum]|uniref:Triosephosphate isomerase n=1 Tax=Clostridium cylindrosporum DSM 605 TaxID=1121307 RepID=A0A0J8FYV6_CLOCY|nr:triose-phosphate isomerase [Clostridium cylindrosporum]KMT20801.1 triosephosphate isomerase TpiA [Clostridium cylindrosporum DSM 605]